MAILFLFVFAIIAVIWYYWNDREYWSKRGIPGPKGRLFYGNYFEIHSVENPHQVAVTELTKKYGKVFGLNDGNRKYLVISDLYMINEIFNKKFDQFYGRWTQPQAGRVDRNPRVHLFEAEGARWKRLRTMSSASFSANSLKKIFEAVQDTAIEAIRLTSIRAGNRPFNIHRCFQEYTMSIICQTAMGQEGHRLYENPIVDEIESFVMANKTENMIHRFSTICPSMYLLVQPLILYLADFLKFPGIEIIRSIERAVDARIQEREENSRKGVEPSEAKDFIDMYLDARVETHEGLDSTEFSKNGLKISKQLTRDEIVGLCFVFLVAAFDTTANTLANTCWFLAKNPEIQQKMRDEIENVIGDDQRVSHESLAQLKYMQQVMNETLRLCPPAPFAAARKCMETTTVGEYQIEKGTVIRADVITVQKDPEIWGENAEDFVPERWESPTTQQNISFLAFGGGSRLCIGKRLAHMEDKVILAHLLREFELIAVPETENELKMRGSLILAPESVTVRMKRRL